MASSRDRQRKLARAKLDRQMARRAAAARRKRRIQASFGVGVAAAVVVVTSVWAAGGFDRDPDEIVAEPDVCLWTPLETEGNPDLRDVGTPATTGLPTSGTRTMTIATDQGDPITVSLDLASAPCAGASFAHLAEKKFFDNTKCHEITEEGALRCGDPTGTGRGGPTYSFLNENIPSPPQPSPSADPEAKPAPAYPAGTVALVGNPPGSNGSQFLIFFEDHAPESPSYPVVGTVTAGLDVVKKIGALETVENDAGAKVKPATDVVIQTITVGAANGEASAS